MPAEALAAPADIDVVATALQIDRQALEEAAGRQQTIASVADLNREKLHLIVAAGKARPEEASGVQLELQQLQEKRMREIHHDASVKVSFLMSLGAAGLFNGKDVILDIENIEERVYLHEDKHREDGLPEDLDRDLGPRTGLDAIDERLVDIGTKRDRLEERAMDSAGEVPAAYRSTHWKTVKDMEGRGREVGVDVEAADAGLIEGKDSVGFARAMVTLAIREIAQEDPDALDDLAEKAEENHADLTVQAIIRETRYRYERGPEAAETRYASAA